jgi:hypothetical protein
MGQIEQTLTMCVCEGESKQASWQARERTCEPGPSFPGEDMPLSRGRPEFQDQIPPLGLPGPLARVDAKS